MKKILVVGSLNMDFSIKTHKMPLPGETVIGKNFDLNPGGKGANQAYAMGKLQANINMLGLVGNDEYAQVLIDNLKSVSVGTEGIVIKDNLHTGVAFVTVDDNGENSIIAISGANGELTEDIIDDNIHLVDEADIIVMQLEIPIQTVMYICKKAKQNNKIVVLDPAPAQKDLPLELYPYIDIIKPNETELSSLTGMMTDSDDNVLIAAQTLLQRGVKNVIVTLGDKGSLLVNQDIVKRFSALAVTVVDTTAAGDSFTAALVSFLALDKPLEDAIQFGHIISSIVVTKKGAQASIPSLDEVKTFMSNRK